MTVDTEKIARFVEAQRKNYDCPNYGQNLLDAIETLKQCQELFIDEEKL